MNNESQTVLPDLRICAIPLDITEGDTTVNLRTAHEQILRIRNSVDLIILPEMFTTGFRANHDWLRSNAASDNGIRVIEQISEWSMTTGAAIAGSFLCATASGVHSITNRGFFIQPDGSVSFYNKRHLFSLGGEDRMLDAGSTQCESINYKGWQIRLAICYDLRFPVWNRRIAGNNSSDYDLLIIPANWPDSRRYAWEHLLIARAIENQAYVAGVDRGGKDEYGNYPSDMTQVFDMWGKPIGIKSDSNPKNITAVLSMAALSTSRERFTPWRDADRFTINTQTD